MADGGAEPQDEHLGGQDPPAPCPPAQATTGTEQGHIPSPPARRGHHSHEETPAEPGHSGQPRGPESPWEPGGSGGGWGPRAGRVAGLYPQLLRELEVQELQQALAARDEVVLHRDRWIRQLELEKRQLRSQVRSLEENDLLSSGGGRGGPLATAATTTGTLLASGTSCIGISDSNIPQGAGGAAGEQCHCAGEWEAQTGTGPQLGGLRHPPAAGQRLAGLHRQAQAHDPAAARLLLVGDAGPVLSHGAAHRPQRHHGASPPPAHGHGQRHQRAWHQAVWPRLQLQRRHQQQVRQVLVGRQEGGHGVS